MMRSKSFLPLMCLVAYLWLAGRVVCQQQPDSVHHESDNGFVIARPLVLLDVIVTGEDGQPLKDLRPEEVTIREDGQLQKLVLFELHEPVVAAAKRTLDAKESVSANMFGAGARTIVVVDAMTLDWMQDLAKRSKVADFVGQMSIDQPVAIFLLRRTDSRVIQDFTTDKELIRLAAAKLEAALSEPQSGFGSGEQAISGLSTSLRAILAAAPGRKNIVLISHHLCEVESRTSMVQGTYGRMGGHNPQSTPARRALVDPQVVTYALDPGGEAAGSAAFTAFRNRIILGSGGRRFSLGDVQFQTVYDAIRNGSTYYWLGYYPTNDEWESRFRVVRQVEVKVNRKGSVATYLHAYQSGLAVADSR